jgi:hypothetical protein
LLIKYLTASAEIMNWSPRPVLRQIFILSHLALLFSSILGCNSHFNAVSSQNITLCRCVSEENSVESAF